MTIKKLITLDKAKEQVKMLTYYIDLVETYETDTIDKLIVKEYALTNSMVEVVRELNRRGHTIDGRSIVSSDVQAVINKKTKDELQRMLRSGYLLKTRHIRS